jgi:hypothetical protein
MEVFMKFDAVIKCVFAVAALLAASTYAWTTFLDRAQPVEAFGVETKDGFIVQGLGFNRQGGFIAVSRWAKNPFAEGDELRHTLSFYELVKSGSDGTAKLHFVGSRVLDYDQGPDLVKFEEIRNETPRELRDAYEKGAAKGRRRGN